MNSPQNKMHPLLMIAAISVTVASLAAIASFTGLLPGKSAPSSELTATSTVPAPAAPLAAIPGEALTPTAKPADKSMPAVKPRKPAQDKPASVAPNPAGDFRTVGEPAGGQPGMGKAAADKRPPVTGTPVAATICNECGTVESVREMKVKAEGSGLGAMAGGLLGGLLGNQVGKGDGRTAATVAVAVGGAYAGHQIERNVRAEKQVEITVRFDDGSIRTFSQQEASRWHQGDRVRLSNGSLLPG